MAVTLNNFALATLAQSSPMAFGLQDPYTTSDKQLAPLGSRVDLADGRSFVYVKAGAVDLSPGKINQSAAPLTTAQDEVVAVSASVGDQFVKVTFGAAVTANQFAGGFLYVNDDTGEPGVYTVKQHAAGTTSVQVNIYEKIRIAITAGAGTVSAVKHPSEGLIVAPTVLTGTVHGVSLVTIPANNYGWVQVKGVAPVLTNGTVVVGNQVIPSGTTAGAVDAAVTTALAAATTTPVGIVAQVAITTEYSLIRLDIPGF